jgi:hypothetical protein
MMPAPLVADRFRARLLAATDGLAPPSRHPRVFSDRLGVLRRRAAADAPARSALRRALADLAHSEPAPPRDLAGRALALASGYATLHEPAFLQDAVALTERLVLARTWAAPECARHAIDEDAAVVASNLALVCDLLWDDLPPRLRETSLHRLEGRVVGLFPGVRSARPPDWVRHRSAAQAIIHAHLAIAVVAAGEVLPDWRHGLRPALEGMLDFLDGPPATQPFRDGPARWQEAVRELSWAGAALEAFSGGRIDLSSHPFLCGNAAFDRHLCCPDGEPALEGLAARPVLAPALDAARSLLAGPAPPPAGESLSKCFADLDLVTMRSDWSAGAAFLALHGAGGALVIGDDRRRLLLPAGEGPLLVDGEGPSSLPEPCPGIEAAHLAGPIPWVVCQLGPRYPGRLRSFLRTLLFVRPRGVVLIDDIVTEGPRHLQWQIAHRGDRATGADGFAIHEGGARARLMFPLLDREQMRYRIGEETRLLHFPAAARSVEEMVVSLAPLHRGRRWVTVAAIRIGASPSAVRDVRLSGDHLRFDASTEAGARVVEVGLGRRSVEIT